MTYIQMPVYHSREPSIEEKMEIAATTYSSKDSEKEHFRNGAKWAIKETSVEDGALETLLFVVVLVGFIAEIFAFGFGFADYSCDSFRREEWKFDRPGHYIFAPYWLGQKTAEFLWEKR